MLGLGVSFYKVGGDQDFWDPMRVTPDPKGWYKASKIVAGEEGEGGVPAVSWADSSTKGNNLTQGAEESRGTIDVTEDGALLLDGTSDHYDFGTAVTISAQEAFIGFFVIKLADVDQDTLLGTGATTGFVEIQNNKRLRIKIDSTQEVIIFGTAQFSSDEKMVLTIQREAGSTGNINVFKNGTLLTPTSQLDNAGAINFDSLGLRDDDRYFGGHIYEVIIYDTEDMESADITRVCDYLKNHHGI